jgi:ligand-binding sensor domain-containing protein
MTTADGLFDNNIFAMTSMPDGSLWVGSYGGVALLRPGN